MRALVASGGGSHGAWEVGALRRWMREEGCDYDIVAGVSVGAINAAFLAQYGAGKNQAAQADLEALWRTVNDAKVKKNWFFGKAEAIIDKPSVFDSSPLWAWIRGALKPQAISSSGKKLRVTATSWNSGETFTATETDPQIADWVIASSAFPCMLSPITLNGELWADGGLRTVTPLKEALAAGATELDVLMCSDPYSKSAYDPAGKTALLLFLRALDILTDEVSRADLERVDLSKVKVRVLKPSVPLKPDSLSFDPGGIVAMLDQGYKDAVAADAAALHPAMMHMVTG
jgi:NTE family protein